MASRSLSARASTRSSASVRNRRLRPVSWMPAAQPSVRSTIVAAVAGVDGPAQDALEHPAGALGVEGELGLPELDQPVLQAVPAPAELEVDARREDEVGVRGEQVDQPPEVGDDLGVRDAVQVVEDDDDLAGDLGERRGERLEERLAESAARGAERGAEVGEDRVERAELGRRSRRAKCTASSSARSCRATRPAHRRSGGRPLRQQHGLARARGRDDERQGRIHSDVEAGQELGLSTAWGGTMRETGILPPPSACEVRAGKRIIPQG